MIKDVEATSTRKNENIPSPLPVKERRLKRFWNWIRKEEVTAPIVGTAGLIGHSLLMGSASAPESQSFFRGVAAIFYLAAQISNLAHPATVRGLKLFSEKLPHWMQIVINDYTYYPFKYFGILGGTGGFFQLTSGFIKGQWTEVAMSGTGIIGNGLLLLKISSTPNVSAFMHFLNRHAFKITSVLFNVGSVCALTNGIIHKDPFMFAAGVFYTLANTATGITKRR